MKRSEKLGLILPKAAGIIADPDTMEVSAKGMARMKLRARGRPRLAIIKVPVTMRLDADVLEQVKSTANFGRRE